MYLFFGDNESLINMHVKNRVLIVFVAIMLNGCCLNQNAQKGYNLGLTCVSPHKSTPKTCDSKDSCDQTVQQ